MGAIDRDVPSLLDADGLPAFNRTLVFTEDRASNVWIGFWNGGVARYRNGRFTLFTAADGWPPGAISSLYVDSSGRLWVGSARGGIGRVDVPAADRPRLVAYTTADGLSSNTVWCVTEDRQGRVYLGLLRGLDRLDPATGRVRHYAMADGLVGDPLSAFRDRQGVLWFGTLRGLSRLVPEPDPDPPSVPPSVFIGGLRIAGASLPVSDLGEREISNLALGPNQNRVQIDFLSVSMSSPAIRYHYRLEGADPSWSEPTDQHSITYASLSPGRYRFSVRAMAADGLASAAPATVTFTIHAPVWRRWWFLALVVTATVAVIHGAYRYRLARLIELERVRTRIATDLHDDIGSGLSQIAILSEVAERRIIDPDPGLTEPISRISLISRELVDSMSDIVWAINPRHDRLPDLAARMRRFANDMLTARHIALRFFSPQEAKTVPIEADLRRQVFLVFKEAIHNAARHSACTEVQVELGVENRRLVLRVTDNGKGFDCGEARCGHGLMSMDSRARAMSGLLAVRSQPGQGTMVQLNVPLDQRVGKQSVTPSVASSTGGDVSRDE